MMLIYISLVTQSNVTLGGTETGWGHPGSFYLVSVLCHGPPGSLVRPMDPFSE